MLEVEKWTCAYASYGANMKWVAFEFDKIPDKVLVFFLKQLLKPKGNKFIWNVGSYGDN